MNIRHGLTVAGLVCVLAAPHVARADAKDASQEMGIRLTERAKLHLALGALMGIDSNPNAVPYELTRARASNEQAQFFNGPAVTVPEGLPHPNKLVFEFPPDAFLALRPSMAFNMPGDRLNANANIGLNYYEYLGIFQPGLPFIPGTAASKSGYSVWAYNSGYRRLRTLDGSASGGLELNRTGPFGLALSGGLMRSVDPGPIVVGTRLARTNANGTIAGVARPGGGTMSFTGSLGVSAEIYDPQNGKDFFGNPIPPFSAGPSAGPLFLFGEGNPVDVMGLAPAANATVDPRQFHNAGSSLSFQWQWRFLPKSAVYAGASAGTHFYLYPFQNTNAPSFPVGASIGYLGQITAKLGLVASVGFTYPIFICLEPLAAPSAATQSCSANTGFINGQPQNNAQGQSDLETLGVPVAQYLWWAPELTRWQSYASAPGGQLEARYQFTPTLAGAVGVRRQLRLVPLYRYLTDNRVYATLVGTFMQRFQVSLTASEAVQPHGQLTESTAGYNQYPFDEQFRQLVPALANSDPGRWDNDLSVSAALNVALLKWFLVGVGNTLTWHATNAATGGPNDSPGVYNEKPFNLSYVRNVTVLQAELRY
ncbi:MAG: hypothetical protein AB2A00_34225 [Myxococcota bacterium]